MRSHPSSVSDFKRTVQTIFEENDLPDGKQQFIEINATSAGNLPGISEQMDPLPSADERRQNWGSVLRKETINSWGLILLPFYNH